MPKRLHVAVLTTNNTQLYTHLETKNYNIICTTVFMLLYAQKKKMNYFKKE